MSKKKQAEILRDLLEAQVSADDDRHFIALAEDRAALIAGAKALEAQAKPSPKVIAEAWAVVDEDGHLVVEPGTCGPQLFVGEYADRGANLEAGPTERAVRVYLVEAPE